MGIGLTYFKRFRMEIDLTDRDLSWAKTPPGYEFFAWSPSLLDAHAKTKFLSFRDEIDAHVFPCFTEFVGCQRLMREIVHKPGFLPEATWLAIYVDGNRRECCGTIQGVRDRFGMGSIQNLGIVPCHRGQQVGTALLFRSLEGFRQQGLNRVHLEVTADNRGAVRLYRRVGFAAVKTVFKAAEVVYS